MRLGASATLLAWLALAGCSSSAPAPAPAPAVHDVAVADADLADASAPADTEDLAPPPDAAPELGADVSEPEVEVGADVDAAPKGAKAEFGAASIDFGTWGCGAPAKSAAMLVLNNGDTELFLVLSLSESAVFSLTGSTSMVVAPGQGVQVTVLAQALPQDATPGLVDTATLTVSTNDPAVPSRDFAIHRSARGAVVVLDPPSLDFGGVDLGQSATLEVQVSNVGSASAVWLQAPADPQFTVTWAGSPTPLTLAPGQAPLSVLVQYTPTQLGAAQTQSGLGIALETCSPSALLLPLGGTGLGAVPLVSGNLDFGALACGGTASAPLQATVSNAGNLPLTFTAELAGGLASPFEVTVPTTTVAGGAQVSVEVKAKALAQLTSMAQTLTDTLVITTNLPNDPPHLLTASLSPSGAVLSMDLPGIAFGAVGIGSSLATTFAVRNSGNAPALVTLGSAGAVFGVLPTGPQVLLPGSELIATATFAPKGAGAQSGTISLGADPDSALCASAPDSLPLTGLGRDGALLVDKGQIDFGPVDCGTTPPPQTLVLTNSSQTTVQWFADLDRAPSHYSVAPAGSGVLAPGEVVTLSVTSLPMAATTSVALDLFGETLLISSDSLGEPVHAVPIRQTARGAILQVSGTPLDFGQLAPGTAASRTWQIRNVGNAAATPTLLSDNAAFSLSAASLALGPGASQQVTATLQGGPAAALAHLTLDNPGAVLCAPLPAPLLLQAQSAQGAVAFAPGSLDFGEVDCGSVGAPHQITFSNIGNKAWHLTAQLGASPPRFAVVQTPADGLVAPGGSLTLTLTPLAMPTQAEVTSDLFGDTLTVTTDAAGDTPHAIALHQTARGAVLSLSASSLDFGAAVLGNASLAALTVTNSGNAPALLRLEAVDKSVFALPDLIWVPAGSTAQPLALFLPQKAQLYSDSAVVLAPSTVLCKPLPLTTLTLSGTGVTKAVLKVAPQQLSFGNAGMVACGQTAAAQTLTLTNQTASSLTVSATLTKGAWSSFAVSPTSALAEPGVPLTLTLTPKGVPTSALTLPDAFGDNLVIKTNAAGDAKHVTTLHMTAQGAVLSFSKPALNLATTAVGKKAALPGSFAVHNAGNLSADVTLLLSDTANFTLGPSSLTVAATQSSALSVWFAPLSAGQKKATVSLATPAPLCALLPQPMQLSGLAK